MTSLNSSGYPPSQESDQLYVDKYVDVAKSLPVHSAATPFEFKEGTSFAKHPPVHSAAAPIEFKEGITHTQTSEVSHDQLDDSYVDTDEHQKICPTDPDVKGFGFSEISIRRGFIRKVYSILMLQLLITTAVVALFMFEHHVQVFVQQNWWLLLVSITVVFTAMIILACCGETRRKAPANYILLCLFTLAMAFLLGVSSIQYERIDILIAVGITVVLCLGLTLFALQTRFDFTMLGGVLFISLIIFLIFGITASVFAATGNSSKILNLVYASLGALLFSVYLIYDTQLMLGGKHKYSISPEEYVFAALNLYVDIINIFIYVLRIVAGSR